MKISCPACEAKYSIADEKVSDRLAKIRCRKCNTTIVIDGKVTPPSVYAADSATQVSQDPAAGEGGVQEYSVDFGDNDQRTLTLDEIVVQYNEGLITAETYLWAEGFSDWTPLGDVAEVVDALHAANERAAAAEAEAPAPAPEPAPRADEHRAHEQRGASPAASTPLSPPEPAPAPPPWAAPKEPDPPRAAARAAGRSGATSDLFGSFDAAGSEEDVTTSAPQDHAPAAPTGARNESSVLFSLSALTSAAKTSKPSQPPPGLTLGASGGGRAAADDSGLIDLKALTAAASSAEAAPAFAAPPPLGLSAPLGVTAPAIAAPNEAVVYPGSRNKTGLYIGAGIAIAATVIAVALILRPAAPTPTTPTATSAVAASPQPAAAPTPAASESAAAAVTAKPPATGTAEEEEAEPDAGEAEKKAAAAKRWTPKKPSSSSGSTTPSTTKSGSDSASAPKPKPKRSACGCAPGDLQCAMRCAAGG